MSSSIKSSSQNLSKSDPVENFFAQVCAKAQDQNSKLKKNGDKATNQSKKTKKVPKEHKCPLCLKNFNNRSNLCRHVSLVHKRPELLENLSKLTEIQINSTTNGSDKLSPKDKDLLQSLTSVQTNSSTSDSSSQIDAKNKDPSRFCSKCQKHIPVSLTITQHQYYCGLLRCPCGKEFTTKLGMKKHLTNIKDCGFRHQGYAIYNGLKDLRHVRKKGFSMDLKSEPMDDDGDNNNNQKNYLHIKTPQPQSITNTAKFSSPVLSTSSASDSGNHGSSDNEMLKNNNNKRPRTIQSIEHDNLKMTPNPTKKYREADNPPITKPRKKIGQISTAKFENLNNNYFPQQINNITMPNHQSSFHSLSSSSHGGMYQQMSNSYMNQPQFSSFDKINNFVSNLPINHGPCSNNGPAIHVSMPIQSAQYLPHNSYINNSNNHNNNPTIINNQYNNSNSKPNSNSNTSSNPNHNPNFLLGQPMFIPGQGWCKIVKCSPNEISNLSRFYGTNQMWGPPMMAENQTQTNFSPSNNRSEFPPNHSNLTSTYQNQDNNQTNNHNNNNNGGQENYQSVGVQHNQTTSVACGNNYTVNNSTSMSGLNNNHNHNKNNNNNSNLSSNNDQIDCLRNKSLVESIHNDHGRNTCNNMMVNQAVDTCNLYPTTTDASTSMNILDEYYLNSPPKIGRDSVVGPNKHPSTQVPNFGPENHQIPSTMNILLPQGDDHHNRNTGALPKLENLQDHDHHHQQEDDDLETPRQYHNDRPKNNGISIGTETEDSQNWFLDPHIFVSEGTQVNRMDLK